MNRRDETVKRETRHVNNLRVHPQKMSTNATATKRFRAVTQSAKGQAAAGTMQLDSVKSRVSAASGFGVRLALAFGDQFVE